MKIRNLSDGEVLKVFRRLDTDRELEMTVLLVVFDYLNDLLERISYVVLENIEEE